MPNPKMDRLQLLEDVGKKHKVNEYYYLHNVRWALFNAQMRSLYDKDTGQGELCKGGKVDWKEYNAQAQEFRRELDEDLDALRSEYSFDAYYAERNSALYP